MRGLAAFCDPRCFRKIPIILAILILFGRVPRADAPLVDQSCTVNQGFFARFGANAGIAQSFTPAKDNITGASVLTHVGGAGIGSVTIALYNNLPTAGGQQLAIGTATNVSAGSWAMVDFGAVVPITPEQTYYLVISGSNPNMGVASTDGLGMGIDLYPRGQGYHTHYTPIARDDINFQTFYSATKLTITTTSLPPITAGQAYSAPTKATGGTLPYTWSVGSGSSGPLSFFPDNVSFAPDGDISTDTSTRVSAGLYSFSVTVKDSVGAAATTELDLTVSCGNTEKDSVTAQYITFGAIESTGSFPNPPICQDFTQTASSPPFQFTDLRIDSGSSWALIRLPLTVSAVDGYGLQAWVANYNNIPNAPGKGSRQITSAYRTPEHNAAVGGGFDSRHMWGDAVDLDNHSAEINDAAHAEAEWEALYNSALLSANIVEKRGAICAEANACIQVNTSKGPLKVPKHAHAEWEDHPGPYKQ